MLSSLLVTGEGPSDMGTPNNGSNLWTAEAYNIGPMAILSVKLIKQLLPEWNIDLIDFEQPKNWITGISGSNLAGRAKGKSKFKPSKKISPGYIEYAARAFEMAKFAQDNGHQLAIYFHDADRGNQSEFVNAINFGFKAAETTVCIVAMIPKPTSEAWLICASKPEPYQHCAQLEDRLSGNDSSPERAPKKVLARHLGIDNCPTETQMDLVREIDVNRIAMPSFDQFRYDMAQAIRYICGDVNFFQ